MIWLHYIACLFAGAFLANTVPHFVHGISGDRFPTPFAKPPGRGLSSPLVNMVWSLANLLVGFVLLRCARLTEQDIAGLAILLAGAAVTGIGSSIRFASKHAE